MQGKNHLSIISKGSTTPDPMSKPDAEIAGIIERARALQRERGMDVVDYADEDKPEIRGPRIQGLTSRESKYSFDNFKGNDKLVATIKEFAAEGKSIMLTGGTGCGKTHLAIAAGKTIPRQGIFVTVPELLLQIRASFNGDGGNEGQIIRRYASADLLILDDLGAEKTTEYSIQTLYTIVSRRNRDEAQTIVTTNLTLKEIADNLGDRIASRLAEMKIVKINMPDYRTKR